MKVLKEGKRKRVLVLSQSSHVAATVQVKHCLGMQAMMQAHSAPADCGSQDVNDLCCDH